MKRLGAGFIFFLPFLIWNCAAPRAVTQTGKVTPKGHFKLSGNYSVNVGTATSGALISGLKEAMETTLDNSKDSAGNDQSQQLNDNINAQQEFLAIYSLDPLTVSSAFAVRYGLIKKLDIGFALVGGARAYDVRYQFLGSTGDRKNPGEGRFYGSAGLQYSSQDYELPSLFGDIQTLFKYEFKRKDIFLPVIFSRSFGPEEKFGAFSFGPAYNLTLYEYAFDKSITNLFYRAAEGDLEDVPEGSGQVHSFGGFINVKAGYKYVYFLMGLSLFYQDYGSFELLADHKAEFSGMTFVPTWGIDVAF